MLANVPEIDDVAAWAEARGALNMVDSKAYSDDRAELGTFHDKRAADGASQRVKDHCHRSISSSRRVARLTGQAMTAN